jgi:hypothetical protein
MLLGGYDTAVESARTVTLRVMAGFPMSCRPGTCRPVRGGLQILAAGVLFVGCWSCGAGPKFPSAPSPVVRRENAKLAAVWDHLWDEGVRIDASGIVDGSLEVTLDQQTARDSQDIVRREIGAVRLRFILHGHPAQAG